ncbi:uncharacterized protein LOC127795331 [Diospyros lotus]|uniref:uncharacterized protein LOC127795331 n=1 Tax=Diospyros lotus TaxID=55363 RepID=UPI00224D4EB1|nr:uncharacterized protein LOC127795331 [Diospyros lotus]
MLLRASISGSKKFFQKTLHTFKSFLSGGYQKLPKTPPFNPFSCSPAAVNDMTFTHTYPDLDNFYSDFIEHADNQKKKKRKKKTKIKRLQPPPVSQNYQLERRQQDQEKKRRVVVNVADQGKAKEGLALRSREGRSLAVAQKLKELAMADKSNIEHVLDIEEVLHYYYRLTCPAYIDIIDKFFMDMYAELSSFQDS